VHPLVDEEAKALAIDNLLLSAGSKTPSLVIMCMVDTRQDVSSSLCGRNRVGLWLPVNPRLPYDIVPHWRSVKSKNVFADGPFISRLCEGYQEGNMVFIRLVEGLLGLRPTEYKKQILTIKVSTAKSFLIG
jgi:hypothetical protein